MRQTEEEEAERLRFCKQSLAFQGDKIFHHQVTPHVAVLCIYRWKSRKTSFLIGISHCGNHFRKGVPHQAFARPLVPSGHSPLDLPR